MTRSRAAGRRWLRPRQPPSRLACCIAVGVALAACAGPSSPSAAERAPGLRLEEVVRGLQSPVHLTAPPGDPRLFVLEQVGRIRIVRDDQLLAEPFLDISDRVASGGERGLLSMAFHPDYARNGLFFVDYTDRAGDTRVERFRVSSAADRADPASARLVLHVEQPFSNHNGGLIAFGPDGKLYVGMGDGGGGGDPRGHAQNRGTLLGALLRLDIDAAEPYIVPADNPFVGDASARGEIWAYGLRNPWRFAFAGDLLYIADVGQNRREEVNVAPRSSAGLNYGWNVMEGSECYASPTCDTSGLVLPAIEYRNPAEGCSVVGGHVYRGAAMPELRGHYFYSDYCRGWLRSFRYVDGQAAHSREWQVGEVGNVLSFGEDAAGELYLLAGSGRVYRLAARP